jgi:hypothetical protein
MRYTRRVYLYLLRLIYPFKTYKRQNSSNYTKDDGMRKYPMAWFYIHWNSVTNIFVFSTDHIGAMPCWFFFTISSYYHFPLHVPVSQNEAPVWLYCTNHSHNLLLGRELNEWLVFGECHIPFT